MPIIHALLRAIHFVLMLPFAAASQGTVNIEDYNGEKSSVTVNLQDLDALNANFGSISQDLDEIKDAIITVTRGEVRHTSLSHKYPESSAPVSDVEAAREGKWLVTFRDTTLYLDGANAINNPGYNKRFTFEIPCADRTLLTDNEDELDLTDTVPAAFVTAMEANIRSPYNRAAEAGVTPTNKIESIVYVGRNN